MAANIVAPDALPKSVIPKSKYNKYADSDIFIPGDSIVDHIKRSRLAIAHVTKSRGRADDIKRRRAVTNNVAVKLNETFGRVDKVPGFKTHLYSHQQTAVKAMLDLEYKRNINMYSEGVIDLYNITYNSAILSEPVGSGKTIDVLALICLSKVPRAIHDIMEFNSVSRYETASVGYIQRKFTKFLLPTIIFVGISVINQWARAIEQFTNLKYYKVSDIHGLRPLLNKIVEGSVNEYDIILVKNGKITTEIDMPSNIQLEEKNKVAQPYIYNIIGNLRDYCWARVVIDDFDTIKLPHNAGIVNGIFTWFISSTRNKMEYRSSDSGYCHSARELLSNSNYGCAKIMYNHLLFENINVRNDIAYVKKTSNMPSPKFWIVKFDNVNNLYISAISGIKEDEMSQIIEMLNGDAIGAAAEKVGIKTDNVGDIFQSILGNKYEKYSFAKALLGFIDYSIENKEKWLPMEQNPDPEEKYFKKDLLDMKEIEYKYPNINSLLKSTKEEYDLVATQTGAAVQRLKDNLKSGECPICKEDLNELDDENGSGGNVIIAKCCSKVFCSRCGIESNQMKDRYKKLQSYCPACKTKITIKDLIYLEDFDLDKIQNEEIDDEDEEVDMDIVEEMKAKKSDKPWSKYRAIIDILAGDKIKGSSRVDMHIPNMMKGAVYLPEPKIRKVLVFASFDETLKKIVAELEEEKIKYWRLMGTPNEITNIVEECQKYKGSCALVINSTQQCSGLNLQFATDLVFSHSIMNTEIETQVAGRGHRLGRESPLNIWFLQYENEINRLISTHNMRYLTREEIKDEEDKENKHYVESVATITDNKDKCFLIGGKTNDKKQKRDNNDDDDDDEEIDIEPAVRRRPIPKVVVKSKPKPRLNRLDENGEIEESSESSENSDIESNENNEINEISENSESDDY